MTRPQFQLHTMTTDEDIKQESIRAINELLWCEESLEKVHVSIGEEKPHTMSIQNGTIINDGPASSVVMLPLDGRSCLTFTLASIKSPEELVERNSRRVTLKWAGSEFSITTQSQLCITKKDHTVSFSFQQGIVTFQGTCRVLDDMNMARDFDVVNMLDVLGRGAMRYQGHRFQSIGTICPNLKFTLKSVSIKFTCGVKTVYNLLTNKDCTKFKMLREMEGILQNITFKFNGEILCEKRLEGKNYQDFLKGNGETEDATDKKRFWRMVLEEEMSLELNHLDKFAVYIAPLHYFEVRGTTAQLRDEEGRTTFRVGEVIVHGKIYSDNRASLADVKVKDHKDDDNEDDEEETMNLAELMHNKEDFEEKLMKATLPGEFPGFPKNFKLRVKSILIPTEIVEKRLDGI